MAVRRQRGSTPLSTLRDHYERTRPACDACGFVDDDADWRATVSGRTVQYVHVCPSCSAEMAQIVRVRARERTAGR